MAALRAAYFSGDSDSGMEDSAQSKCSGPSDNESDHSDDVAAGDVESVPKKQITFGSELQLHNYFSVPALQSTAVEKDQMAKYSDPSHVMHPTGKIIGLCCSSKEKKTGSNFSSETKD